MLIVFALLAWEATRQMTRTKSPNAPSRGNASAVQVESGDSPVKTRRPQRDRTLFITRIAAALAGLVVGAEVLVEGAQRILESLGWSQTTFGSVVVATAVSAEEGFLELVPAHKGHPKVSIGNVLGTIPFLLLASLGAIGVIHPIDISGSLRSFQPAALVIAVAAALWCLTRKRTDRHHGMVLVGLYALYIAGTVWL